jgi:hypothetical protein
VSKKSLFVVYGIVLCMCSNVRSSVNVLDYEEYIHLVNQVKEVKQLEMVVEQEEEKLVQELISKEEEQKKLSQELENLAKEKQERRNRMLRELDGFKKEAQRQAEYTAQRIQDLAKEWNSFFEYQLEFYNKWMDDTEDIWENFKRGSFRWQSGGVTHISVNDTRKIQVLEKEKNRLKDVAYNEKLRVKNVRRNKFEPRMSWEMTQVKTAIQKTEVHIAQFSHGWIREQKDFWQCKKKDQEAQLAILADFKANGLKRFLELDGLWKSFSVEW